jgi:hypothetical protein
MQDEKSRNDSVTPSKTDAEKDATSKDTVADLKKGDQASTAGTEDSSRAESTSTPSPDGQFDKSRESSGIGE